MLAVLWIFKDRMPAKTHRGFRLAQTVSASAMAQTITGSIMGAGAVRGRRAVRWGVAGNIMAAWVLTIPMSALVAAAVFEIVSFIVE
jgi:phosphate/sulfate permease